MEHSYSKDIHPEVNVEVMSTRSILIPRPPQCPSCHQHSTSDDILAVSIINSFFAFNWNVVVLS